MVSSNLTDYVRNWKHPRMSWTAWVPGLGWTGIEGAPWYFCGTSKTWLELKPGESCAANLAPTGDGIYRFTVDYYIRVGPKNERRTASSKAVQVDNFDRNLGQLLEVEKKKK